MTLLPCAGHLTTPPRHSTRLLTCLHMCRYYSWNLKSKGSHEGDTCSMPCLFLLLPCLFPFGVLGDKATVYPESSRQGSTHDCLYINWGLVSMWDSSHNFYSRSLVSGCLGQGCSSVFNIFFPLSKESSNAEVAFCNCILIIPIQHSLANSI